MNKDPLFKHVSLQTINRCNRKCEFCANKDIKKEKHYMSIEDLKIILEQLERLEFNGRISPYLQSEPLLDKRMPEIISLIRRYCPYSYIMINTNGDLLDENLFKVLFCSGINCITVNCYDNKNQYVIRNNNFENWVQNILDLSEIKVFTQVPLNIEYQYHSPAKMFVILRDCSSYSINSGFLTSRMGNIQNKKVNFKLPIKKYCRRPFEQIYINSYGYVILCCEDWKNEIIMGNNKEALLIDIWQNSKFGKYRMNLEKENRNIKGCRTCDFIY
ncbi:MAG: radical SAM/SPASM domain-containing protein [Promethearchaeota archaeon]